MVADLVKAVVKDEIEDLRSKIKSKKITLEDAQEEAWISYGYPEGSTKSGPKSSNHKSTTWGELFGGGSTGTITVTYEPIFESLGDTLDDTPYYEVYIKIETTGKYPHTYSGSTPNKELEAIEALEESDSIMRWFNQYCGDHRFG